MDESPQVGVATAHEQRLALGLVFSGQPEEARRGLVRSAFKTAATTGHGLNGLLVARRRDTLVGACWAQVLAGRAGFVWPPGLVASEPRSTANLLIEQSDAYLLSHHVQLSQVLSDGGDDDDLLLTCQYHHAADLSYLVCSREQLPATQPVTPLTFEPFRDDQRMRLEEIVERTYEQTMDCPTLNGVRQLSDVITGYQSVGVFSPDHWLLVRHGDTDVGCLLLADHPDDDQWELVYMGVVPAARGNGWGEHIARHGAWLTRAAGRRQMMLAVDATNKPALEAYGRVGFEMVTQRSVYLKVLT